LKNNDLFFIEYELVPFFPPILEFLLFITRNNFILDYDDAVFHNYDKNSNFLIRLLFKKKIPYISKLASCIITGSPYLTDFFKSYNENVVEIPTSISFDYYNKHIFDSLEKDYVKIGWIGSKSTSKNIYLVKDVINYFSENNSNVQFIFMGFDEDLIPYFNYNNTKFLCWSELNELEFLNSIDIGIMPLIDNSFNHGKCGFKLIQYMACGKPTISTPFATNLKINRDNHNMFANSTEEYIYCINKFLNQRDFFKTVGQNNLSIIKKYYSIESNNRIYLKIFNCL
jgi:glycosyltransferase involved in cell wall biosynthesis